MDVVYVKALWLYSDMQSRANFLVLWSGHVGFVVDKVALRQVFSEYFGFPCQYSFHRLLHTHHLSSGVSTIDQLVPDVPSGLCLTPPQETKKIISICFIYLGVYLTTLLVTQILFSVEWLNDSE
jgi:hypothetical protein